MKNTLQKVRQFNSDELITLCYVLMEQASTASLDTVEDVQDVFFRLITLFVAASKLLQRGLRIRREICLIVMDWSSIAKKLWREVKEEMTDEVATQLCADLAGLPWDSETIQTQIHGPFLGIELDHLLEVKKRKIDEVVEEEKNSDVLGLKAFIEMLTYLCLIPRGDAKSVCFGQKNGPNNLDGNGNHHHQVRSFTVVNESALQVWQRLIACILAKNYESSGLVNESRASGQMLGTKEVFNMVRDHRISKILRDDTQNNNNGTKKSPHQFNVNPKVGDVVIHDMPAPDDVGGREVAEWLSIVVVLMMMTGPYRFQSVSTLPLLWFAKVVYENLLDLESLLSQPNLKIYLDTHFAANPHIAKMFAMARHQNTLSFTAGPAFIPAENSDRDCGNYKANPTDDTSMPGVAHCFSCGVPINAHSVPEGQDRKLAIKNCAFKRVLRHWAFVGGSEDEPPKAVKKK